MSQAIHDTSWTGVDEGWGRRAAEFAALSEPANCREYVSMHHHLGVRTGHRVLDVACGAGLAVELAGLRGATCAGIDASARLVEVARRRCPRSDLRIGDMHDLPWVDDAFDVVTSFRGIWGTTPDALVEARRVLRPGGWLGLTVWGHLKTSPGAWALAPFRLAADDKIRHQAAMVALGRPGAGEELLASLGFVDVRRIKVPFAWEFADPESFARALASTGPAYEAIQRVGEEEFQRAAVEVARAQVVDGLPLRAEIDIVGYLARRPAAPRRPSTASPPSFLAEPAPTPAVNALYEEDMATDGYVANLTRLWAHQPETLTRLFALMGDALAPSGMDTRQRGVLVTAAASTLGDSYCSLAWGGKLAREADPVAAANVLTGTDEGLTALERAIAAWARKIVDDPNATTSTDVDALHAAGLSDAEVFSITAYIALRVAFSTINDALGARPDPELVASLPDEVRRVVIWGRRPAIPGTEP